MSLPIPSNLPAPDYDANALRVLNERYFAPKDDGSKETATEFAWRVASAIATVEGQYADRAIAARGPVYGNTPEAIEDHFAHEFYGAIQRRDFNPNTPCLINAGRPLSMLSACFVIPVEDSMDGIYSTVKAAALVHQGGGGTGFGWGSLRHAGAKVESTGRQASGPIPFMKVVNASTDAIKQSGVRRGANMGVLPVYHPDIIEFIRCKRELDNENLEAYNKLQKHSVFSDEQLAVVKQNMLERQFNNFNISVGITREFMAAVEADSDYNLYDTRDGSVVRTANAREVFNEIVYGAWKNGEPGVLFIDHPGVNAIPGLGPIVATNPCGEVFLHGWDACNLGSLNLGNFMRPAGEVGEASVIPATRISGTSFFEDAFGAQFAGKKTTGDLAHLGDVTVGPVKLDARVDWARLAKTIRLAVRFLDNVVDASTFPLPQITDMVRNNRRIGLGYMGFADMIVELGIGYGTPEAIAFAKDLGLFFRVEAEKESENLATERGEFNNKHLSIFKDDPRPRRNVALLTIAPTGTIAMIAGASGYGCEPYFGLAYTKNIMKDAQGKAQALYYVVKAFDSWIKANESHVMAWAHAAHGSETFEDARAALLAAVEANRGSVQGLDMIPAAAQRVFRVAGDVTVEEHLDMLAAFQTYTCNAVSKTINAPNDDTLENVEKTIFRAFKSGCKGFTYYRDGSRQEQVVTLGSIVKEPKSAPVVEKPATEVLDLDALLAKANSLTGGLEV